MFEMPPMRQKNGNRCRPTRKNVANTTQARAQMEPSDVPLLTHFVRWVFYRAASYR